MYQPKFYKYSDFIQFQNAVTPILFIFLFFNAPVDFGFIFDAEVLDPILGFAKFDGEVHKILLLFCGCFSCYKW